MAWVRVGGKVNSYLGKLHKLLLFGFVFALSAAPRGAMDWTSSRLSYTRCGPCCLSEVWEKEFALEWYFYFETERICLLISPIRSYTNLKHIHVRRQERLGWKLWPPPLSPNSYHCSKHANAFQKPQISLNSLLLVCESSVFPVSQMGRISVI